MTETLWISTTGKWDDASGWTDGVPTLTKTARLGGGSNENVRSGLTGAAAKRLITTPAYRGTIASPGTPLEIQLDDKAVLRGVGAHYIEFDPGGYAVVVCDSDGPSLAGLFTGSIGRICVKRGLWRCGPTAGLAYQVVVDGPYAELSIDPADSTENMAPLVVMAGGMLTNDRPAPTGGNYFIVVSGGELLQRGVLAIDDYLVKTLGGVLRYEPLTAPATDPMMFLDGLCDFSKSSYTFGVDKCVIGRAADILGTTLEAGGYPPGTLSAPIDLREDYP